MGLLIGALVAALGTVAAGLVLRGRARHQPSLYSTQRALLVARVEERRGRALGPVPSAPAAVTATVAAPPAGEQAAPQAAPSEPQGPGSAPPPEAIQVPTMPVLPAFQLPPGAAGPPAATPAPAAAPVPPHPLPEAGQAGAGWLAVEHGSAPPPAVPSSAAPAPGATGPGPVPEPEGPGWSIVEQSDGGRRGGREPEVQRIDDPSPDRGWSVQPHSRHASEADVGKPPPHRLRGAETLFGIVTYAALAAALVAVLLGMLIMLATTR